MRFLLLRIHSIQQLPLHLQKLILVVEKFKDGFLSYSLSRAKVTVGHSIDNTIYCATLKKKSAENTYRFLK